VGIVNCVWRLNLGASHYGDVTGDARRGLVVNDEDGLDCEIAGHDMQPMDETMLRAVQFRKVRR
jgi:hypothetical protein